MITWMLLEILKNLVKKPGGDIMANKKTFLWLRAMESATVQQKNKLTELLSCHDQNKIEEVLRIYKSCNIDAWAKELKQKYYSIAMEHLEEIAVVSARKKPLQHLAEYLMERDIVNYPVPLNLKLLMGVVGQRPYPNISKTNWNTFIPMCLQFYRSWRHAVCKKDGQCIKSALLILHYFELKLH